MNKLTKEDAIKRIKDIKNRISVDHLETKAKMHWYFVEYGAIAELMAIFDIKESEL